MEIPKQAKIIPLLYIGGALVVLFIIYKFLAAVGLIKTKAKKKEEAEKKKDVSEMRTLDYFNPLFMQGKTFKRIGDNAANLYAEQLRKATRGMGTNEERIYATFGKLNNKLNICEVAAAYYVKYKEDLQSVLLAELTDKEKVILYELIDKLPNF